MTNGKCLSTLRKGAGTRTPPGSSISSRAARRSTTRSDALDAAFVVAASTAIVESFTGGATAGSASLPHTSNICAIGIIVDALAWDDFAPPMSDAIDPRLRFVVVAAADTGAKTRSCAGSAAAVDVSSFVSASRSTAGRAATTTSGTAPSGASAPFGLKLGAPTACAREIKSATCAACFATSGASPRHSAKSARVVDGTVSAKRSMSARGKTYPKLSSASRAARSRQSNNAAYTANCGSLSSFKLSVLSKSS